MFLFSLRASADAKWLTRQLANSPRSGVPTRYTETMPGSGLILGIETSCDETAAAVVERGARTLSSVVASQISTHARYGGVVPELASREHLRAIVPVVRAALAGAHLTLADLDAIGVTSGPGLAGALLVGITYAKALAFANNLPLIAVNHLEGHIHAVLLNERESGMFANSVPSDHPEQPEKAVILSEQSESKDLHFNAVAPSFPQSAQADAERMREHEVSGHDFSRAENAARMERALAPEGSASVEPALALVVSGGHTHLYLARPTQGTWAYTLFGRTVDDAAGEAFDKVAKLLGLGYPGGPWIDALARFGNPHAVPFAFAQVKPKVHLGGRPPRTKAAKTAPIARLDPRFLFSFSGIKTAVLRYVELHGLRAESRARHARLFSREDFHPDRQKMAVILSESPQRRVEESAVVFETAERDPHSPARPPQSREEALALCPQPTLDLIASFQHAVVGDLMKKTFAAAESQGAARILVTGGVAANRELRARFTAEAARRNSCHPERAKRVEGSAVAFEPVKGNLHYSVSFPTLALSTDNAAMIAAAAWPRFLARDFAPPNLTADPSLTLG